MSRSLRSEAYNREIGFVSFVRACERARRSSGRVRGDRNPRLGLSERTFASAAPAASPPRVTGRRISLTKYEREAAPDAAHRGRRRSDPAHRGWRSRSCAPLPEVEITRRDPGLDADSVSEKIASDSRSDNVSPMRGQCEYDKSSM